MSSTKTKASAAIISLRNQNLHLLFDKPDTEQHGDSLREPGSDACTLYPALNTLEETGDVQTGINLVKRAVEEPLRQIAYNAGLEGSVVVEKVKNTDAGIGFNALTEEYIDMVKAGIVDPAKVTRSALQNAASIASLVLTTETIVADKVEENAAAPAMPPMGGMGGMM